MTTFELDLATATVYDLKSAVQDNEGIPHNQQRMIFGRDQLEDERLLADYNINMGDTVKLVLKLRGDIGRFSTHENTPGIDLLSSSFEGKVTLESVAEVVKQVRASHAAAAGVPREQPRIHWSGADTILDSCLLHSRQARG